MSSKQLPSSNNNNNNESHWLQSDVAKIILGGSIFMVTIILYSFEFSYFNNTLDVSSLLIIALMLGVFFGTLIGDRFKKYGDTPLEIFQIYAACIILTLIVMPLLISLTNRLFNFSEPKIVPVEFVETQSFIESRFGKLPNQKPSGYFTFVIHDGEVHRIKTKENPFPNAKEGDKVNIPIAKGIWQFEWIAY